MQQLVKVRLRIQSLSPWDHRYHLILIFFCLYFHWLVVKWVIAQKQHTSTWWLFFYIYIGFFFFSIKIVSKVFTETFLIIAQRHQYCDILWKRLPGAVLHRDVTGERGPWWIRIYRHWSDTMSVRETERERARPSTWGMLGLQVLSSLGLLSVVFVGFCFVFLFCFF